MRNNKEDQTFRAGEIQVSSEEQLESLLGERAAYEPLGDLPAGQLDHRVLKEQVMEVLNGLTPRERRVLELRFGLTDGRSHTQKEVGTEIGRSATTVGRIERKALFKMREPSRTKPLRDYLA